MCHRYVCEKCGGLGIINFMYLCCKLNTADYELSCCVFFYVLKIYECEVGLFASLHFWTLVWIMFYFLCACDGCIDSTLKMILNSTQVDHTWRPRWWRKPCVTCWTLWRQDNGWCKSWMLANYVRELCVLGLQVNNHIRISSLNALTSCWFCRSSIPNVL